MPTATQQRQWIRASFQEYLTSTFPGVTFNFGDNRTDLDALLASASPLVLVDWLKRSGSTLYDVRKVSWPVQLTVFAKLNTDPYGGDVDTVVSQLVSGLVRAQVPIKDYTSSPTDTGYRLTVLDVYDDDISPDDVVRAVAVTVTLQYFER